MKRVLFAKKTTGQSQTELLQCLQKLQQRRSNKICCDCNAPDPEWAVIFIPQSPSSSSPSILSRIEIKMKAKSVGVFVCYSCSVAHTILGAPGTIIKSISLGSWKHDEVLAMERGGNLWVNGVYEADLVVKNGQKPCKFSDMLQRQSYCHLKYTRRFYFREDGVPTPAESKTLDEDQMLEVVTSQSERPSKPLSVRSIPENWEQNVLSEHHDDCQSKDLSEGTPTTAAESALGSIHSRLGYESSSHSTSSSSSPSIGTVPGGISHSRLGHGNPSSLNLSSHSQYSVTPSAPRTRATRRMSTGGIPLSCEINLSGNSLVSVLSTGSVEIVSSNGSPNEQFSSIGGDQSINPHPSVAPLETELSFRCPDKNFKPRTRAQRRMSIGAVEIGSSNGTPNEPRQRQRRRSSIGGFGEQSMNPHLSVAPLEAELHLEAPNNNFKPRTRATRRMSVGAVEIASSNGSSNEPRQRQRRRSSIGGFGEQSMNPHLSVAPPETELNLEAPKNDFNTGLNSTSEGNLVYSSPDSEISGSPQPKPITRHQSLSAPCRSTATHETGRRNSPSDFLQLKESKDRDSSRSNHRLKCTDADAPKHKPPEMDVEIERSESGSSVASPSFKQHRKRQQHRHSRSRSQSCRTGLIGKSNRADGASETSVPMKRKQSLKLLRESLGPMNPEVPN